MRALLQRVSRAAVRVEGRTVGAIEHGLLMLVCAMTGDTPADVEFIVRKSAELRIFPDDAGKMSRSVQDLKGAVLVVSQFTLAAETKKGRRPDFTAAAPPDVARALVDQTVAQLAALGLTTATGQFGAMMDVELVNAGPVTIWLDSRSAASAASASSAAPSAPD